MNTRRPRRQRCCCSRLNRATMVDCACAGAAHQACRRARSCLQDAVHQTPPNVAPNCRLLSLLLLLLLLLRPTRWPCNESQQQPADPPFISRGWHGRHGSAANSRRSVRLGAAVRPSSVVVDRLVLSCYCTSVRCVGVDGYRNV